MDRKGVNDVPQRAIGSQHGVSFVSVFNSKQRIYSRDHPRYVPKKIVWGHMKNKQSIWDDS